MAIKRRRPQSKSIAPPRKSTSKQTLKAADRPESATAILEAIKSGIEPPPLPDPVAAGNTKQDLPDQPLVVDRLLNIDPFEKTPSPDSMWRRLFRIVETAVQLAGRRSGEMVPSPFGRGHFSSNQVRLVPMLAIICAVFTTGAMISLSGSRFITNNHLTALLFLNHRLELVQTKTSIRLSPPFC